MFNVVEAIESKITPADVTRVSDATGTSAAVTRRAMSLGAVGIVAALARRSESAGGAASILSSLRSPTSGYADLLGDQQERATDSIARSSGLSRRAASGVLASLLPIAGGVVGHEVLSRKLDAGGLSDLLRSQRQFIPSESFAETDVADRDVSVSNAPLRRRPAVVKEKTSIGLMWLLAALGILALLGLLIFAMRKPETPTVSTTETPTINTPERPSATLETPGPEPEPVAPMPGPAPKATAEQMGGDLSSHFSGTNVPDRFSLSGLNFEHGTTKMTQGADATLDAFAAQMKEHAGVNVRLEGFTDSTGTVAQNRSLSYQRAVAVKKALTDRGVDASRIETLGRQEHSPVRSNESAAGRAANRRVDAVITKR